METSEVLLLAYAVSDALKRDARVQALNQSETLLNQNSQVCALARQVNDLNDVYNHVSDDVKQSRAIQKELHQAKLKLDSEPLVRIYFQAFQPVRQMYQMLQDELFTPFNWHQCEVK